LSIYIVPLQGIYPALAFMMLNVVMNENVHSV